MEAAARRAYAAGADAPLRYVGAGAEGIIFAAGVQVPIKGLAPGLGVKLGQEIAWKVFRSTTPETFHGHEASVEYLMTATLDKDVRSKVATFYGWHPEHQVLLMELIEGRPANWGTRGVREAYEAITALMRVRYGWSGPEYKEDSFVQRFSGWGTDAERPLGLVLVDVGFVLRHGKNLIEYVEEVLRGERRFPERREDLLFALRMAAMDKEIDASYAEDLQRRLVASGLP